MDTPRLELVEITDEDAFFEEPPAPELFDVPMSGPKRPWLWCGAIVSVCALAALAGFHVGRTHEAKDVVATIVAAPPPVTPPPVNCIDRAEPKPSPAPVHATTPVAAPKRPSHAAPRSLPKPAAKPGDPLTL